MRKLVITQNVTLDGSVEMLDPWFEPADDDTEVAAEIRDQAERSDAVLFGRQTFTDMRGFWPQQTDDTTGVTDHLNTVQKYVVSSTLADPQWQNSMILSGDPVEEVRRIKAEPGRDIVLTGSIQLAHTLTSAGLIDEFRMFVFPAVQGRGRGLFPDGYSVAGLRLVADRTFGSGVRYAAYQPGE